MTTLLKERYRSEIGVKLASIKQSAKNTRDQIVGEVPARTAELASIKGIAEADTDTFTAADVTEIDSVITYQTAQIADAIDMLTADEGRALLVAILEADGYTVTPPAE